MFCSKLNTRKVPLRTLRTLSLLALLGLTVLGLVIGADWSSAGAVNRPNKQNASQSDELWKDVSDTQSLALTADNADAPKQSRLLQLNKTLFSSVVSKSSYGVHLVRRSVSGYAFTATSRRPPVAISNRRVARALS